MAHEFKNSSSILNCDYDDKNQCMTICFVSGGTYKFECPKSVYEGLCKSDSPGKHFHSAIKPHYKGTKS